MTDTERIHLWAAHAERWLLISLVVSVGYGLGAPGGPILVVLYALAGILALYPMVKVFRIWRQSREVRHV